MIFFYLDLEELWSVVLISISSLLYVSGYTYISCIYTHEYVLGLLVLKWSYRTLDVLDVCRWQVCWYILIRNRLPVSHVCHPHFVFECGALAEFCDAELFSSDYKSVLTSLDSCRYFLLFPPELPGARHSASHRWSFLLSELRIFDQLPAVTWSFLPFPVLTPLPDLPVLSRTSP